MARYLIINNAISSTWGFPMPCPVGCPCDCFDCRLPECACAVPADMSDSFPTSFLVDYIRVYQLEEYVHCVNLQLLMLPLLQYYYYQYCYYYYFYCCCCCYYYYLLLL
jgi:hypothetical protein